MQQEIGYCDITFTTYLSTKTTQQSPICCKEFHSRVKSTILKLVPISVASDD